MPDLEKIEKHLSSLISGLKNLEKHKNVNEEKIKKNTDLLWILERGIYLSIQNLFDILAHIASADFNKQWDYYSDLADIFYDEKLISEEQKKVLTQMVGFRNRLSHDYLSLELNIIVDIVNNRLEDFNEFIGFVKVYCKL